MDLVDFQFSLGDQTLAVHRQLLSQLICSPDRERKWVLSGFAITSPTGTQVQVAKGRGLLAETRSGATYYGILTTEGDATKIVDINTYASGVYGVYVRFEEVEGNFQPRIFWNASGLGSEYTETIATRYLANWSLRVEATSPGDEWLQIGTVNRADMAIVDMRDFYFEGPVDGSYASGWSTDGGGDANDRNADRKTYGIADFQKFSAATRQCLEDIKGRGLRRWWARDIGGMNLGFDAAPTEDRLALGDATFFLDGGTNKRWQFDTDDHLTYDRTENALTLAIGSASHNWDATSQSPGTTNTVDLGKTDKRYANLYLAGDIDLLGSILGSSLTVGDSIRMSRAAAGAGERNWQFGIADVGGFETFQLGSQNDAWSSFASAFSITRAVDSGTITKIAHSLGGVEKLRLSTDGLAVANGLYVGSATEVPADNVIYAEGDIKAMGGSLYLGGDDRFYWNATNWDTIINGATRQRITSADVWSYFPNGGATPVEVRIREGGDSVTAIPKMHIIGNAHGRYAGLTEEVDYGYPCPHLRLSGGDSFGGADPYQTEDALIEFWPAHDTTALGNLRGYIGQKSDIGLAFAGMDDIGIGAGAMMVFCTMTQYTSSEADYRWYGGDYFGSGSSYGHMLLYGTITAGYAPSTLTLGNGGATNCQAFLKLVGKGAVTTNPSTSANFGWVFTKTSGGVAEVFTMDGSGNVNQISPHDIDGTWIFNSKNVKTGIRKRVNMEQLVRLVENLTGEKLLLVSQEETEC
jgi:hypothetical protein